MLNYAIRKENEKRQIMDEEKAQERAIKLKQESDQQEYQEDYGFLECGAFGWSYLNSPPKPKILGNLMIYSPSSSELIF